MYLCVSQLNETWMFFSFISILRIYFRETKRQVSKISESLAREVCNEREIGQQSVLIEEDDFSLR
jgi:hypothetical protein